MRTSNSKLSQVQKSELKSLKQDFENRGGVIVQNVDKGVTVAIVEAFPGSNTMRVSTSVQSPDERKFRRKVGEFHALQNMENERFIVLPKSGDIPEYAEVLAYDFGIANEIN